MLVRGLDRGEELVLGELTALPVSSVRVLGDGVDCGDGVTLSVAVPPDEVFEFRFRNEKACCLALIAAEIAFDLILGEFVFDPEL